MTIAIVDDSASDIRLLQDALTKYCQENKVHAQVDVFTDEITFLHALRNKNYELAFLDIYMKHTTGIKVAQKLRQVCERCQIIFTTTSKDHAINAFRLHALDYLVKPYSYDLLADAMGRFAEVSSKLAHYIELKEGRHYTKILISDIVYTDYYNHYIQVHTRENMVRSYMSFDDFSPMLEQYSQFLWCYRNCLVNMDYIETLDDKDFILKTGERLPISKARKKEVTQAYADYLFDYVNGGQIL